MKHNILTGYMCTFINRKGEESLVAASFAASRTKSKEYFKAQQYRRHVEPVQLHKVYEVNISVGEEVDKVSPPTPKNI